VIQMPLTRLQMMGQQDNRFIFDFHWNRSIQCREVELYAKGRSSTFDNRVLLKPNVGEYVIQLNGLLRPLIQRRWAAMVAQLNRLRGVAARGIPVRCGAGPDYQGAKRSVGDTRPAMLLL